MTLSLAVLEIFSTSQKRSVTIEINIFKSFKDLKLSVANICKDEGCYSNVKIKEDIKHEALATNLKSTNQVL